VTDHEQSDFGVPLAHLPPETKATRAGSFGGVAAHYERYRPGPPVAAVEWLLPEPVGRVVDLGAGTGALTRLLRDRAGEVVAVEPDDRMRAVLAEEVPGVSAVKGTGESLPLPDGSVDAVLASSSWHWMEPVAALREVRRVLVPRGVLGVLWSGPDPEGAFLAGAQAALARRDADAVSRADASASGPRDVGEEMLGQMIMGDGRRPASTLEIPAGAPFAAPEHEVFRWDVALDADELIGLLGTFSWIITMPEETRERVLAEARRLLSDRMGVEGGMTVDVTYRADAWRSRPIR
jgi:SAM-dependent methyltransferase